MTNIEERRKNTTINLQAKKHKVREAVAKRGFIQKDKTNEHSSYKYFSEAGYKKLFVDLFAEHGIELKVTVLSVQEFVGTGKMPFGRRTELEFKLICVDTGESEESVFMGEGVDSGDKAIYKAYTGAIKYFLATTFTVPTGDDPETVTQDEEKDNATSEQMDFILSFYDTPEKVAKLLKMIKLNNLNEMTSPIASVVVQKIQEYQASKKQ